MRYAAQMSPEVLPSWCCCMQNQSAEQHHVLMHYRSTEDMLAAIAHCQGLVMYGYSTYSRLGQCTQAPIMTPDRPVLRVQDIFLSVTSNYIQGS